MPDRILTDDDCARIDAEGGRFNRESMYVTVEGIVAERTRVLADEIEDYRQGTVGALRRAEAAEGEAERLREQVSAIEAIAYRWIAQPNDYDEDTAQQIEDGWTIKGALDRPEFVLLDGGE